MADKSLRSRLQRLFSTNVIVRHAGGKTLKIADTSRIQTVAQKRLIDRYSRLYSGLSTMGGYGHAQALSFQAQRIGLFRDYEEMDNDAIISSALDIYADESTMKSEYGKVLEIRSDNDNIHDILYNLYYDILNIEFNLWPWVRNMCKYGDFYLNLDIADKYGIVNVVPLSSYDVTRVEGEDIDNPYYTKFIIESQDSRHSASQNKKEFENFEIAHFRLLSDSNFLPYGKSMVEGARKIWKQVSLMEDAMLIHRIMRAPEKRIFRIDIGNIPPAEVDNYMQKIINKSKKAPVLDEKTGDYNLRYNIQNLTEDFFMPVRGGDSGTQVDSLPGLTYDAVEDIEYLRNKLMAALKIPKAYLGYEENVGSKCLHPNTKIPLLNGTVKTIKEIADEFNINGDPNWWVYSYDVETNSIIPTKIKLAEQTRKNAELVRVYIDNETYVDCTPDHNFVLKDGNKRQAKLLNAGDSLQAVYRQNKKLANNSNEYEQIYQPSTGKWQWTHKMVDEYLNDKIENNGWQENGKFDRNSLSIIHHSDFNRFNNSPDNLVRMRFDEHIKLHSNNWKNNAGWLKMQKERSKLNKLPENRNKSSEIQKQRIEDNTELRYKLKDSWMSKTHEERSDICKKGWDDDRLQITIDTNKKHNKAEKMRNALKEKYPDGRLDLRGNGNGKWRNRPRFIELISFMEQNKSSRDLSTIYKFSNELGLSKGIVQEVIETNGYTVDEWMNYYWGFKIGRKKHLKYEDFVELSSGYANKTDFLNNSGMGERALYSNIDRLNIDINYWKNNILSSVYNHKIVKVERLSERVDTYNLEVDNENHNYLIDNGIIIKNSTLAAEDVRFARTIERIQRIITSELTKIGIVHLYSQGYTDAELVNFELNLKNPSTIYEEEKIELWNNKQGLASSLLGDKIADSEWIYDNVFKFTEEEKKKIRLGLIKDQKRKFRWDQIESEGNDPVHSGEAVGTQGSMMGGEEGGGENPFGRTGKELDIEIPKDGWPGSGRPKEGPKHGKDSSIRGRDPLGAHDKRKGGSGSPKYGLALAHYDALKKSLGKIGKEEKKILFESSDVEEEYKNEVSSSLSGDIND